MSLWLQKQKFNLNLKQEKHFCSISDQLFRGPRCPWPRLRLPGSRARQRRSVQSLAVHLNPTDGRLVWAGRLSELLPRLGFVDSFPPLETSPPSRHLAAVVRCKVQVTSPNGHLLSVTYLSIHIIQTERGRGEGSVGCWGAMLTNADARTKV